MTCERIRAAVEWLAAYFAPAACNSAVVFCVIQVRGEAYAQRSIERAGEIEELLNLQTGLS